MLYTQWVPYAAFVIAFLAIMSLGVLEIARGAEAERVRLIGYMCAILLGGGAVFSTVLGASQFLLYRSAVREAP
jgi:hypothetical protein